MASPVASLRGPRPDLSLGLAVWLAAFVAALAIGLVWMELPVGRLWIIGAYLVLSSTLSSVVGFVAYRLTEARRRSIRTKIVIAHALGASLVILNIFAAARLMFISTHDLGLLMLLLTACAVFSVTFGAAVAARMTTAVAELSAGAHEVSRGNFSARVAVSTNDELADLARSFNQMVTHVNTSVEQRNRAESARRELIAAVSHDLRTPLTAIRAMLEALEDGVVSDAPTVARYHSTMRTQIDMLSRLIDDLFEMSQLDAGGAQYEMALVDLASLVSGCVEGLAMSASDRAVAVTCGSAGDTVVRGDAAKLARVVNNLVENAVRHSPPGSTVTVTVRQGECEGVLVAVADHGSGVAVADEAFVFERFFRGEKSRSREHGGAGLGLAIARGIVEAHGGRIWHERTPGGGATFAFWLSAPARDGAEREAPSVIIGHGQLPIG